MKRKSVERLLLERRYLPLRQTQGRPFDKLRAGSDVVALLAQLRVAGVLRQYRAAQVVPERSRRMVAVQIGQHAALPHGDALTVKGVVVDDVFVQLAKVVATDPIADLAYPVAIDIVEVTLGGQASPTDMGKVSKSILSIRSRLCQGNVLYCGHGKRTQQPT